MKAQSFNIAKRRLHHKRKSPTASLPAALALVSAAYDAEAAIVTMIFSRAINIDNLSGADIIVNDAVDALQVFEASAVFLDDPVTLRGELISDGASSGSGVRLSVAANVIVAADDASPWEGCSELELPFP